jgi:hypothetical protein
MMRQEVADFFRLAFCHTIDDATLPFALKLNLVDEELQCGQIVFRFSTDLEKNIGPIERLLKYATIFDTKMFLSIFQCILGYCSG